jgi:hypothetical protein
MLLPLFDGRRLLVSPPHAVFCRIFAPPVQGVQKVITDEQHSDH